MIVDVTPKNPEVVNKYQVAAEIANRPPSSPMQPVIEW